MDSQKKIEDNINNIKDTLHYVSLILKERRNILISITKNIISTTDKVDNTEPAQFHQCLEDLTNDNIKLKALRDKYIEQTESAFQHIYVIASVLLDDMPAYRLVEIQPDANLQQHIEYVYNIIQLYVEKNDTDYGGAEVITISNIYNDIIENLHLELPESLANLPMDIQVTREAVNLSRESPVRKELVGNILQTKSKIDEKYLAASETRDNIHEYIQILLRTSTQYAQKSLKDLFTTLEKFSNIQTEKLKNDASSKDSINILNDILILNNSIKDFKIKLADPNATPNREFKNFLDKIRDIKSFKTDIAVILDKPEYTTDINIDFTIKDPKHMEKLICVQDQAVKSSNNVHDIISTKSTLTVTMSLLNGAEKALTTPTIGSSLQCSEIGPQAIHSIRPSRPTVPLDPSKITIAYPDNSINTSYVLD